MKNTTVSFLIICVIGAFLIVGASIDFDQDENLLGAVWIGSLALFLLYVWFTSVFVMRPDHMIPSFFLGTFQGTYISGTFANKRNKYDRTMLQCGGQRGLFGTDVVLLLWPLYRGVIFPTGAITVYVHAKVFTKKTADSPSLPVHIDFALVFGLTPNLSDFFTVFDVLSYECNLAETVSIEYTLELDGSEDESEGEKKKKAALTAKYNDLRIAQVIIDSGAPALLEALLVSVGDKAWDSDDQTDLKEDAPGLERAIMIQLGARPTVFHQGGLLTEDGDEGHAIRFFDPNTQRVKPSGKKALEALDEPTVAAYGVKKFATEAGITAEEAWRGKVLENTKELKVIAVGGEGIMDVARNLFGSKSPPSGGTGTTP